MNLNVRIQAKTKKEKLGCRFIINQAVKKNIKTRRELLVLQKRACEEYKIDFVTHTMLLATYRDLVKNKKIRSNQILFQLLRKRRIRTSSGIAAVAVLTKPYPCPGKCIYCPDERGMPKSYLSNEPAVMRANMVNFNPIAQIFVRLRGLEIAGNLAEKIELIVMGGTFSYLPRIYQLKFTISCYWACNRFSDKFEIQSTKFETNSKYKISKFKTKIKTKNINKLLKILKLEQGKNEKSKYRIVGLTLETRPDYIDEDEIKWFRDLGCTRVEMGIQSIYDRVLNLNNRGHKVSETIYATKLLKNAGFKVCYHIMPNLYGSNKKLDLQMFRDLFTKPEFQPDLIKIYPCVLTANTELEKLYRDKKFIPYTDEELIKLLIDIKRTLPEYVRVQRLYRDIPAESILAGSKISNIRQILKMNYKSGIMNYGTKKQMPLCRCIRCREIREDVKSPVTLKRINYNASDGEEIFLQYVDKNNRLYALLRLRLVFTLLRDSNQSNQFHRFWTPSSRTKFTTGQASQNDKKENDNIAIIREVHTYGQMVGVGKSTKKNPQHSGLGKRLIKEAERIAKDELALEKIAVISGVGVRGYYRKLGYRLCKTYMVKKLKNA